MLKLVEWKQFFINAKTNNRSPYIAQVNQNDDMAGWALINDGEVKEMLSDDGLLQVWQSLDVLIGQVFEEFGLYHDVHVYYAGEKQIDLNENVVIEIQRSSLEVS